MTIFGGIIGTIIGVGIFLYVVLYFLAYFFNFIKQGLRILKIFLILAVFALIFDLLSVFFTKENDRADGIDFMKEVGELKSAFNSSNELTEKTYETVYKPEHITEANMEEFIYHFLKAYEANDITEVAYYMDSEAKITKLHLDYMSYQEQNGISLDLIAYQLLDMYELSSDTFEVITSEQFAVTTENDAAKNVYQEIRYTVKLVNDTLKISELEIL